MLEPGLVDIHAYDKNKRTALHWAAQHGHLESVNCLLDNDACLEASEDEGNTALTLAVKGGHKEVVELLLQRNARVDTRNSSGKNALDIALARRGYWEYKYFPNCDLVEPILMQLAKCSEDVQAECLRCASGGPYDNVYSYTFTKRPDLFDYLMLSLSSMNTDALESAIDRHPELIEPILRRWAILDPALQNRCLLKFSHEAYDDVYSYVLTERPEFFNSLNSYEEPDYILTAMRFNEHLQCICTHYQLMKAKSQDNSNYIIAAEAAKTLLIECAKAKDALGGSHDVNQIRLFQETCKRAIENAKPVLKKYREWGKVLAAFLLVIITFPISLPLAAMGFFSVKTKSEQLLDKLNKAIECDRPLSYQGNSV